LHNVKIIGIVRLNRKNKTIVWDKVLEQFVRFAFYKHLAARRLEGFWKAYLHWASSHPFALHVAKEQLRKRYSYQPKSG
jgi:hypothetical protein